MVAEADNNGREAANRKGALWSELMSELLYWIVNEGEIKNPRPSSVCRFRPQHSLVYHNPLKNQVL